MDEFLFLTLLSISIFISSYFCGFVPTVLNFTESKVRLLTVLGSGILVGTALSVIIPEGVNSIYSSSYLIHSHLKVLHKNKNEQVPNFLIGITLIIGFGFMLLIDQIASRHSNTQLPLVNTENINLNISNKRKSSKFTATFGLIIHSAADGIALGASATTLHRDVEMIIFLAIMLHKAPASFGLVTFLIHKGLDRKSIRKHLIYFSISAPLSAFLTYFFLNKFSRESVENYNATGIAMLFSAGTFLYVATVHVLTEITHDKQLNIKELLTLTIGLFLPLILTFKHHH